MKKQTSLKDIANKVGVSVALVSYVLNGKEKEKRVGADVAEQIRLAAKELFYQPNQIARSLRKGSTKTIGLIVADIANPFFSRLTRIIEDEAAKKGYSVLFGSSDEDITKSAAIINSLVYRQVDGFIIAPPEHSESQVTDLLKLDIPVVLMDRFFQGINTSYVCLDHFNATYSSTVHLIKKKYRRIALVVYQSDSMHIRERVRGYREAMKNNRLEDSIQVLEIPYRLPAAEREARIGQFLAKDKTISALVFANNSLCISCLYVALKQNIKVPEELAIVGFDTNEAFDFFYAPLTYVEQPLHEIGSLATELLIDLIEDKKNIQQVTVPSNLIIRQSS